MERQRCDLKFQKIEKRWPYKKRKEITRENFEKERQKERKNERKKERLKEGKLIEVAKRSKKIDIWKKDNF